MSECDHKSLIMRRPWPTGGTVAPMGGLRLDFILCLHLSIFIYALNPWVQSYQCPVNCSAVLFKRVYLTEVCTGYLYAVPFNVDKSSFERAEQFRYLETNLTNQNSVQEEITS